MLLQRDFFYDLKCMIINKKLSESNLLGSLVNVPVAGYNAIYDKEKV